MSVNPIDPTNTDKPSGSLEELFRHHLADAAVPPRPMLWEQIDNSLLQQQNESYRRRLNAMRWVAAASLLLASLTGTGWLAMRDAVSNSNRLASTDARQVPLGEGHNERSVAVGTASNQAGANSAQQLSMSGAESKQLAQASAPAGAMAANVGAADQAAPVSYSAAERAAASARSNNISGTATTVNQSRFGVATNNGTLAYEGKAAAISGASQPASISAGKGLLAGRAATSASAQHMAENGLATVNAENPQNVNLLTDTHTSATSGSGSSQSAAAGTLALGSADWRESNGSASTTSSLESNQESLLAGRLPQLTKPLAVALPTSFAALEVPADGTPPVVPPARKWQFGASYAAGVFQPNTNFSRAGGDPEFDYNPALGPDSPALSEAAAAEHLENLQPGISHRVAVRATRRLNGRWALSTGAELSQSYARSSSSMAFVGEQVPDFGPATRGQQRTTDFRYRTASVPVEVRYANPVKRGWSAYGRVGAVVSALLGVRSDVEGIPEATRSYSLTSAGTPYRRVLTSVRGGAGAQFRPAEGNWTLTLGPVVEMGLLSLNAHPAQGVLDQSRPYGIGLEAGVEFGRGPK